MVLQLHGAMLASLQGSIGSGGGLIITNGQQLLDSGTFGTFGSGHCGQKGGV
jgi:hypothetical protein